MQLTPSLMFCVIPHDNAAVFQLNFIGVTVEPERRYIHFPSNKHMFTPVPVGEKTSPKQVSQSVSNDHFLLLLCSRLDLWGLPFSVRFLHVTPFLCVWFFFYPAMEIATFRLCGMCMLGVLLLLAFIHLGHECQDLLSQCDGMHVCTDWTLVYTLIRQSF